jgi:hypothetical protein
MPDRPRKEPLTLGRRIAAAIGIIIMGLTGGCSLLFLSQLFLSQHGRSIGGGIQGEFAQGEFAGTVLVVGGIPFAVGFLIWGLAVYGRRGNPDQGSNN